MACGGDAGVCVKMKTMIKTEEEEEKLVRKDDSGREEEYCGGGWRERKRDAKFRDKMEVMNKGETEAAGGDADRKK